MDHDNVFADHRTVDCYRHRPAYPDALYRRLRELVAHRRALLDLGCGPGKISRQLAGDFDQVDAIDPSAAMLDLARTLSGGRARNLHFVHGAAESAPLAHAPYDLVVAAASIHWMDQPRLFARLRRASPHSLIAIVDGDGAHEPPWQDAWQVFMSRWIPRLTGLAFGAKAFEQRMRRYIRHIDVLGDEAFVTPPQQQSVTDFILCQHSRKTFAYSQLGARADAFDAELRDLLLPYSKHGLLSYRVRTSLVWGTLAAD